MPTESSPAPRHDLFALSALTSILLIAVGFRWQFDNWLGDYDRLNQFLPWFGYVGERLREFQVPAWNPADSSGAPFAGMPNSGWMFLPVMFCFTIWNVLTAYKMLVLLHAVIAGFSTYWFSRIIGLNPFSALFAATAFAVGPMLYGATMYATPSSLALMFFPLVFLGLEQSIRSPRWSGRLGWAAVAGIAITQVFTGSPPRFIYGAMLFAGWLLYRAFFSQIAALGTWRDQFLRVFWTSAATGVAAATFGAAAILPQLDFTSQGNIKGGDYSDVIGGGYVSHFWTPPLQVKIFFQDWDLTQRPLFFSATVFVVLAIGILLGRNRFGVPLFALDFLLMIDIASTESVTRRFFNLLPGFEQITSHRPTAAPLMMQFSLAMLAGAGIQILQERKFARSHWLIKVLPTAIFLLLIWYAEDQGGYPMGKPQLVVVGIATVFILLPWVRVPWRRFSRIDRVMPQIAVTLLLLLSLAYPMGWDFGRTLRDSTAEPEWTNIIAYDPSVAAAVERNMLQSEPGTTAAFMQQQAAILQPFRYAPYFRNVVPSEKNPLPAASQATQPGVMGILANGRATRLGLEQIPGYNAVHLAWYVDYTDVMNGTRQDYHYSDIFLAAVNGSPLLDMLNVKYVLVPNGIYPTPGIVTTGKLVFWDENASVYENPDAFDRAWIVHDVQPDQDGAELQLLNAGLADGHVTAFVHGDLPPVSTPADAAAEFVTVSRYEPETIELQANLTGDGLVVLSEMYADGWNAYVDGEKVDILRTNHALRGVPVTSGSHTIVLKYEPRSLTIGLWSTCLASVAMIGIWGWALVDRWHRRSWTISRD
jgi:hypothetical protein